MQGTQPKAGYLKWQDQQLLPVPIKYYLIRFSSKLWKFFVLLTIKTTGIWLKIKNKLPRTGGSVTCTG
jgi:hypothetical protein